MGQQSYSIRQSGTEVDPRSSLRILVVEDNPADTVP